jgi:hypothetical protein
MIIKVSTFTGKPAKPPMFVNVPYSSRPIIRTCMVLTVLGQRVVDGLLDGPLGFGGEDHTGASLLRLDGTVWPRIKTESSRQCSLWKSQRSGLTNNKYAEEKP